MRRALTGNARHVWLALVAAACGAAASGDEHGGRRRRRRPRARPAQRSRSGSAGRDRELDVFKKVVGEYDAAQPEVTVKVVGGINDDKIIAALRGGNGPDVVSSFTSVQRRRVLLVAAAGSISTPTMKQRRHRASNFPASAQYYTQYKGMRCALPMLADVYGLYYNKALFTKAGITAPPKTITELTADAKKLTTRKNADGSLKVVGYDPFFGFYQNTPGALRDRCSGRKWVDDRAASRRSRPTRPGRRC